MQAQADEEMKGEPAARTDLDIGGYEDDSEDEREIKEAEENQKDVTLTLNEAGASAVASAAGADTTLVVCGGLSSQSLVKIMYGADWQEIGEATSKKSASNNDASGAADSEPKSLLKLYSFNAATPFYFALPDLERLSGVAVNQVTTQLFG